MSFFSNYTKEGKGVTKEQANAPAFIQFFRTFATRFWSMIGLNLIYLCFCIPIVTIGPATAGMTKVLRNWSRRENAFVFGDFWEAFKQNFLQAFIVNIINIVVWGVLIFDTLFFLGNPLQYTVPQALVFAVIVFTAVVWLFMNYYLYLMLVTFRLTLKQLYKNAFIFAWAGFFRNIGITLIIAATAYIFTLFIQNPLIWIIYILIFTAFCGYVITFITYPLVKKYMIDNVDPETGERLEPKIMDEDE